MESMRGASGEAGGAEYWPLDEDRPYEWINNCSRGRLGGCKLTFML